MIQLNAEQDTAVAFDGNLVITACPGSGKTRVLTARVIRALGELKDRQGRIVALTFTNRAADEIQLRLDQENVEAEQLWAGTIHSFALEWVLRPYAPYCDALKNGFTVANEFYTEHLLEELKRSHVTSRYAQIQTVLTRTGDNLNSDDETRKVFRLYKAQLRSEKLIDYDDVLYLAYRLLIDRPEIASTISSIMRVVCVDEVQDIQDLQFAILSAIYRAANDPLCLFFVGDENQSIYESLGALTKNPSEIAAEFGLPAIKHLTLKGNYRSTQRIVDLYRLFRPDVPPIQARAAYAAQPGVVTFSNQTIFKDHLAATIAERISAALRDGVPTNEICVVAPHWWHVRSLARHLVNEMPEIDFDAPGLSPLHSSRENFWFKIARLLLTRPSPARTRTRMRWAKEALSELRAVAEILLPDSISTPRRLLRMLNGLVSGETEGLAYLHDMFSQFLRQICLDIGSCASMREAYEGFFRKAEAHLANIENGMPTDVDSFRRLFSHPAGVVVSTCHGVKGEEYDTVVAFGLLRGYIPNWDTIIHAPQVATDRESKLLYVICSRAKRRLHLIAEYGRQTQSKNPYETSYLLGNIDFPFDH